MVFDQWAAQNHIPKRKLTPVDKLSFIGKRGMGAFEFIPATPGLESSSTLQIENLYQLARRIFEEREEISMQDDEALPAHHSRTIRNGRWLFDIRNQHY
ncbi:MAG: hypothetical protein PHC95_10600 [Parabacteroides sp.]|nr:hypothetical protein [Parabacteroides sp.]